MAKAIRKVKVRWGAFELLGKIVPMVEKQTSPSKVEIHQDCHQPPTVKSYCPSCKAEIEKVRIVKGETQSYCPKCNARIDKLETVQFCSVCNKKLKEKDVAEAYEVEEGYVILTEAEEKKLARYLPSSELLNILNFVPQESLDPLYIETIYILVPEKKADILPYSLLYQGLLETKVMAICEGVIHKPYKIGLKAERGMILVTTLHYYDEIFLPEIDIVSADVELLKLVKKGIRLELEDFEPNMHCKDEYRERLRATLAKKIKKEEVVIPAPTEIPEQIAVLTTSLQQNISRLQEVMKKSEKEKKAKKK